MNINEIARRLDIPPKDLKELLPQFGFGVGIHAIKVDDIIASRIIKQGYALKQVWRAKQEAARAVMTPAAEANIAAAGPIVIPPSITVKDFATKLGIPITKLLAELMKSGVIVSLNERIDAETATIVAEDLGRKVMVQGKVEEENIHQTVSQLTKEMEQSQLTSVRPPVVVIMGHVDHGKTRLLDAIRKTHVMEGEAGGITQHIGAYQVTVRSKNEQSSRGRSPSAEGSPRSKNEILRQAQDDHSTGRTVTFIDTPGHEAFTTMRSRGAKIADVAVLVVAADDGVQPQTKEAIKIIKGSDLPFVVALNKIDKDEANPEKVKKELSELEVIPEEWGGKIPFVPVSAKAGTGIDQLLDMVLLVADLDKEKRKTDATRLAVGTIIEAHVDPGAGPLATILVQLGTLRTGDVLGIRGMVYGKVRALKDWFGRVVTEAPPGMPVVVLGLRAAPEVGDIVVVPSDVSALAKLTSRDLFQGQGTAATIERSTKRKVKANSVPLIVRADVLGSLETILLSLEKLSHPEVSVAILSKGLGAISEADVLHAESTGATIVGFHTLPTSSAAELAREKGVTIQLYKIIYDLLDFVKAELQKRLPQETVVVALGKMQVLAIFKQENDWSIVGGKVLEGTITPSAKVRIVRKGEQIGEGFIKEVRAGKEVVTSIVVGQEGGLKIIGAIPIQPHDVLEVYTEEQHTRTLT
ncbi:translation initiation factor IF-2 N-terminal domain-containing protein [Candidatus Uhrbacteria bacterium]|nr:translation initiation factor IF-2 N-terminal domain-containing protein [Candidatus Uhrbacteria bacterium]